MQNQFSQLQKFLRRCSIGAIPVFIYAAMIAYFAICIRPKISGDLFGLSNTPGNPEYVNRIKVTGYRDNMVIEYQNQDSISRILTIGDSFSNLYPNSYQNCLAHILGEQITNIPIDIMTIRAHQALKQLIEQGFFDKHKEIKIVILEFVQRNILAFELSFPEASGKNDIPYREINKSKNHFDPRNYLSETFDAGNKWIIEKMGIAKKQMLIADINQESFTMPNHKNKLYFYYGDLNVPSPDINKLQKITSNLSKLHDQLDSKGVKLVFMIIPDKYDLYQGLIKNNPYPRSEGGERLIQTFDTIDYSVNILPALRKELASGEKDLYICSDTHWSGKGAQIGAEQLAKKLSTILK